MVLNIQIQTEINRQQNKLYAFQKREFHPNLTVLPVTGKFYARHECPDINLLDPDIEDKILKKSLFSAKARYDEPITTNMEYGWYSPEPLPCKFDMFRHPKISSWITQIGSLIAQEDRRIPKKKGATLPQFKM